MRERLFVLGLLGLLAGPASVYAHEDGTTPPAPEGGTVAPRPLKPAPVAATPTVKPAPTVKSPPPAATGKGGPSRPLRLTLEEKDRPPTATPASGGGGQAEPAPVAGRPAAAAQAGTGGGEPAVEKRATPLKLAPSAKEIESERKTVLKPQVENRPDRYENQRPDIPSPTQVRRVPGPGSGVGSTASDRKATMIENSGPQQNTTYRRW